MNANFFIEHAIEIHLLAGLLSIVGGFALIGIFKLVATTCAGLADKAPTGVSANRTFALGAH